MGRTDRPRARDASVMVAAHDVAVEAEADHEQEPTPGHQPDVDADRALGGDGFGQDVRVAAQAEVPGDQVFGARRQDGHGNARLLVEQGRNRAVTADGHQAAATGIAGRAPHQERSLLGRPGDLLAESGVPQRPDQALTRRNALPMPELRLATTPTQSPRAGSSALASDWRVEPLAVGRWFVVCDPWSVVLGER